MTVFDERSVELRTPWALRARESLRYLRQLGARVMAPRIALDLMGVREHLRPPGPGGDEALVAAPAAGAPPAQRVTGAGGAEGRLAEEVAATGNRPVAGALALGGWPRRAINGGVVTHRVAAGLQTPLMAPAAPSVVEVPGADALSAQAVMGRERSIGATAEAAPYAKEISRSSPAQGGDRERVVRRERVDLHR